MGRWAGGVVFLAILAYGTPAAAEIKDSAAPRKPLAWLVGQWSLPADRSPAIDWSEPVRSAPATRRIVSASSPLSKIALSVEEKGDVLEGTLEAISENGSRRSLATFAIDRGQAHYPLSWREAGVRYRGSVEGPVQPNGDRHHLRFSRLRSPSNRRPYPIIIEFSVEPGELVLRRVQGPQHGAAVDQVFRFR